MMPLLPCLVGWVTGLPHTFWMLWLRFALWTQRSGRPALAESVEHGIATARTL